jgi:hypothetical protein
MGSNHEPSGYKPDALTNCAMRPFNISNFSVFLVFPQPVFAKTNKCAIVWRVILIFKRGGVL